MSKLKIGYEKRVLRDLVSLIISTLFIYTDLSKLIELQFFQDTLQKSPFIPVQAVSIISITLPVFELLLAFGLFVSKFQYISLFLSFLLMLLFTTYTILIYFFSPEIPCACGGIISSLSWPGHIILNSILTILLLITL